MQQNFWLDLGYLSLECGSARHSRTTTRFGEYSVSKPLNREELKKKRDKYMVPGLKHLFADPPNFVRGKMQYLYDEKGTEYLDMFAGIVTVSVGHCNPKVTKRTV